MACPQVRLPAEQGMCRGGELFRAGADDRAAAQVMVARREHARGPSGLAVSQPGVAQLASHPGSQSSPRHDPIMPETNPHPARQKRAASRARTLVNRRVTGCLRESKLVLDRVGV
jgi:hypothetical protein